jgi:hypothetical protein
VNYLIQSVERFNEISRSVIKRFCKLCDCIHVALLRDDLFHLLPVLFKPVFTLVEFIPLYIIYDIVEIGVVSG